MANTAARGACRVLQVHRRNLRVGQSRLCVPIGVDQLLLHPVSCPAATSDRPRARSDVLHRSRTSPTACDGSRPVFGVLLARSSCSHWIRAHHPLALAARGRSSDAVTRGESLDGRCHVRSRSAEVVLTIAKKMASVPLEVGRDRKNGVADDHVEARFCASAWGSSRVDDRPLERGLEPTSLRRSRLAGSAGTDVGPAGDRVPTCRAQ